MTPGDSPSATAGPQLASADELMAAGPADVEAALRAAAPPPDPQPAPPAPTAPQTPQSAPGQGTPSPAAESGATGQAGPVPASGGAPRKRSHRATGNPRGRPPRSAGPGGPFTGPVSDPPGRATASKIELQAQLEALEAENAQLRGRVLDVDTQRLRVALNLSFGAVGTFAAQKLGPEAALDGAECDTLSEAWAAALAPYLGEYMQESPLIAAGLVTAVVIQSKRSQIAEARKHREAVSRPAAPSAVEVKP